MLDIIQQAWHWIGLEPAEVVTINQFGNLIVRATDGAFWRICPEHWSCEKIAGNANEFAMLASTDDFRIDWEMSRLVEIAQQNLGPLADGNCYCLKMPGVIGGKYDAANLGTISLEESISFAGYMALQIKDVNRFA